MGGPSSDIVELRRHTAALTKALAHASDAERNHVLERARALLDAAEGRRQEIVTTLGAMKAPLGSLQLRAAMQLQVDLRSVLGVIRRLGAVFGVADQFANDGSDSSGAPTRT